MAWFRAALCAAVTAHGLMLAALLALAPPGLLTEPASPSFEVIEVPTLPQAGTEPVPPVETAAANTELAAADPVEPRPEPPQPARPLARLLDPAPPLADLPSEGQATTEAPSAFPPEPATSSPQTPPPPRVQSARPRLPRAPTKFAAAEPTDTAVAAATGPNDLAVRETLTGRIRNAVQAAVQCPAAARMMGQSGKAAVAFDYRDGAVAGSLQLVQSSGTPILDSAALAAVRNAHYPAVPPQASDQILHLLIWVEEACNN